MKRNGAEQKAASRGAWGDIAAGRTTADDDFDPYFKWFGIPPREQPANHYRLLGVPIFVEDAEVISNAADQRMILLKGFQSGPHSGLSQRILNEVSTARVCLLNPERKAAYDTQLMNQVIGGMGGATQAAENAGAPLPIGIPVPTPHSSLSNPNCAGVSPVIIEQPHHVTAAPVTSTPRPHAEDSVWSALDWAPQLRERHSVRRRLRKSRSLSRTGHVKRKSRQTRFDVIFATLVIAVVIVIVAWLIVLSSSPRLPRLPRPTGGSLSPKNSSTRLLPCPGKQSFFPRPWR